MISFLEKHTLVSGSIFWKQNLYERGTKMDWLRQTAFKSIICWWSEDAYLLSDMDVTASSLYISIFARLKIMCLEHDWCSLDLVWNLKCITFYKHAWFCCVLCYGSFVIHDDVIKWKHFPRYWPFVREFAGPRTIPHTKASDAELWCFLWSASE